ncbi:chorismate-binding protein [Lacinutrix sp. Hel_I_90]|uniref:chorismate-binding protein n=1 Tax=Lacinutrix sp. Hel_I_90 TaxID=1249999 RepID=UPI0005C87AC8|nr:chorismate-binding protein [Lacinutrix sp. Hel_I_90]
MDSDDFFEIASAHFEDALPFVLYSKPQTSVVKGLFQNDSTVHTSTDLSESGFIFAPFNSDAPTILIPINESHAFETECFTSDKLGKIETYNSKETTASIEVKAFHVELVSKAIKTIHATDLKKVVISRKETVSLAKVSPIQLFKRLLEVYTSAFVYCWYHPKIGLWLGATPETLLSVASNRFKTMALAGTQEYTGNDNPQWGGKETEEQQLVTDYIAESLKLSVNNLSIGTTQTIRAGNLLHLQTMISGTIDSNLKTIVNALHPTPAVCGLPKIAAKQFIINNENYKREFYTGFLGELNSKEKTTRNTNRRNVENSVYSSVKTVSNLYVNLRCMQLTDVNASIYVGGGITKDSNPESEWEETVSKSETMKKVLF